MSQSENCSNEISVMNQESKVNGKVDSIEGQLSFMGEGTRDIEENSSAQKEDNSFSLPALSLFPKRFDDSQDNQDDLRNTPDIPNGHNNPDAVDIAPRTKSLDELLQESEGLPDTELIGCTKDFVESKMETPVAVTSEEENKDVGDKTVEDSDKKDSSVSNTKDVVRTGENDKESKEGNNDRLSSKETADSKEDKDSEKSETIVKEKESKCNAKEVRTKANKDDSFKLEISDSNILPVSDGEAEKEKEMPEIKIEQVPEEKDVEQSCSKEADKEVKKEVSEECSCDPGCHVRMKLLKDYLDNACKQLNGYIKIKKHEDLTNFLKLLTDIQLITENKKTNVSQELLSDAFQEEGQSNKKRKPRASKITKAAVISTPKKEVPEKKSRVRESKTEEPMSEINFKNLKGLAVFAKWPNSGWYYPGIIEGLDNSDWKDAANVTVKFYDGLVREMKNINILPAHLIPATSIVCDLDDETEMVVLTTNRIDNNCVAFTVSTKEGSGKNMEVNFNKLAIRASNMKTIKQQLEPNMDVTPKKMHMVSLDNLVSGRRSRIRTHRDDDEENPDNSSTPRKNVRKSFATYPDKSSGSDENVTSTPKVSPNKRGVAAVVERSTPKRTSTSNKRMKQ